MAEGVGFEPTRPFGLPVFKTGAINHSTTPPAESARVTLALPKGSARPMQELDRALGVFSMLFQNCALGLQST
jgi:hypothetical protein